MSEKKQSYDSNLKLPENYLSFNDKDYIDDIEIDRMTTIKSLKSDIDHDNFENLKYDTNINKINNYKVDNLFQINKSIILIPILNLKNTNDIQSFIDKKIILEIPYS